MTFPTIHPLLATHLVSAFSSLLGAPILAFAPKGTVNHVIGGRLWALAMIICSFTSVALNNWYPNLMEILSAVTILTVFSGLYFIRVRRRLKGEVAAEKEEAAVAAMGGAMAEEGMAIPDNGDTDASSDNNIRAPLLAGMVTSTSSSTSTSAAVHTAVHDDDVVDCDDDDEQSTCSSSTTTTATSRSSINIEDARDAQQRKSRQGKKSRSKRKQPEENEVETEWWIVRTYNYFLPYGWPRLFCQPAKVFPDKQTQIVVYRNWHAVSMYLAMLCLYIALFIVFLPACGQAWCGINDDKKDAVQGVLNGVSDGLGLSG